MIIKKIFVIASILVMFITVAHAANNASIEAEGVIIEMQSHIGKAIIDEDIYNIGSYTKIFLEEENKTVSILELKSGMPVKFKYTENSDGTKKILELTILTILQT